MTLKETLFNFLFYFELGKSKGLGRFVTIWNDLILLFVFLKAYNINITFTIGFFVVIYGVLIITSCGYWYIKKGYYKKERMFYDKNDYYANEILNRIKKIEKRKPRK